MFPELREKGERARQAAHRLAILDTATKNNALKAIAAAYPHARPNGARAGKGQLYCFSSTGPVERGAYLSEDRSELVLALDSGEERYTASDLPIIGTGGVSSGRDAVEMLMAGATAVGIGSAVYDEGPEAFGRIAGEMDELLSALGYGSAAEAVGAAHR